MYRSSIQKRMEELEVDKDHDNRIEKGWEIASNSYKEKSTAAMTKKDWKDLMGNISFVQGAKAKVCKSMGDKNTVVYVCDSVIDRDRQGRFREVSAPWCPFNGKVKRAEDGGEKFIIDHGTYNVSYPRCIFHNKLCCGNVSRSSVNELSKILRGPINVNKEMNIQQMSQFLDETINVGGEIKSWNIYRGKKLALDYGNDAYDKQFSLIPAFVNEFNKSNPNSHAWVITDSRGRFKYFGICLFPIVNFFKHCGLNNFSTDACHSSNELFPGKLYVFSGRDRFENKNYSCAVMYSANSGESAEDWRTFAR